MYGGGVQVRRHSSPRLEVGPAAPQKLPERVSVDGPGKDGFHPEGERGGCSGLGSPPPRGRL